VKRERYVRLKRLMDIILAVVLLVLLSPLMAITALAVLVFLGKPVLFRQLRPGLDGAPFELVKFRTMHSAPAGSNVQLPDEVRLTRFGRWLRASSLDELPELWNVLKGDMSFVGPRPLLMEYLPLYSTEQMRRHSVRPGLTGWAQVNGRNNLSWAKRFEMDVWYVDHMSLSLDLKIMARTFTSVLGRRGISQPGHATAEKFRGS
jgi:sugar transferase EpsL